MWCELMPAHGKTALVGRREEVREVSAALRRASDTARLLMLHGEPGIGKTTVAETAIEAASRAGVLVLRIDLPAAGRAGLGTVADRTCELLMEAGARDALPLIKAVRRVRAEAAGDRRHHLPLMLHTQALLQQVAQSRQVSLVLDDVHHLADEDVGVFGALLCGLRADGVPVVVCGQCPPDGPAEVLPTLAAAADQSLELSPLTWAQTGALAGRRLGLPAAPELVTAVRTALGTLAGNPRAVLATVAALWREERLTVVDGHACPADRALVIALPVRSPEQPAAEAADETVPIGQHAFTGDALALLARLTAVAETTVDDFLGLAPELGGTVAHVGQVLDTLVARHLVTVDDRQRLSCAVPALGQALQRTPARWYGARLHAQVVLNAKRRAGAGGGALDPRLCDHVLAAGSELPVSLSTELLLAAVRRDHGGSQRRTARACLALLCQLPRDDECLPGILRGAIGLMLDHGDAAGLLGLGAGLLPGGNDRTLARREHLVDLASAWALAALHEQWLGNHVVAHDSPPARTAMRVPTAAALIALALRMRGEPPPPPAADPLPDVAQPARPTAVPLAQPPASQIPAAAEMLLLTGTLGTREEFEHGLLAVRRLRAEAGLPPPRDIEQLRGAAAFGDWATAFEAVLGDRCARFEDSPLRLYQALVREYLTGSWETALTLARRVETYARGTDGGPLYDHSRSLAAEICRWQGDTGRAADWLRGVVAPHGRGPLASWARAGLRHDDGDAVGAWREGWREYRVLRAGGHLAGLERLLLRLAIYAVQRGHHRAGLEALEALEELHACVGAQNTQVALLLARAVVREDVESALAARALPAWQGDQLLSFLTSLWLARTTGSPTWLTEAWEWCERLSARRARQLLVEVTDSLGQPVPRRRASRSVFTAQELRVVRLVAEGRTNRQIAAVLARSEKSVETYLASIFERTGCRSRLELATAWLDGALSPFVPG